jgi:hypothetical protein
MAAAKIRTSQIKMVSREAWKDVIDRLRNQMLVNEQRYHFACPPHVMLVLFDVERMSSVEDSQRCFSLLQVAVFSRTWRAPARHMFTWLESFNEKDMPTRPLDASPSIHSCEIIFGETTAEKCAN